MTNDISPPLMSKEHKLSEKWIIFVICYEMKTRTAALTRDMSAILHRRKMCWIRRSAWPPSPRRWSFWARPGCRCSTGSFSTWSGVTLPFFWTSFWIATIFCSLHRNFIWILHLRLKFWNLLLPKFKFCWLLLDLLPRPSPHHGLGWEDRVSWWRVYTEAQYLGQVFR